MCRRFEKWIVPSDRQFEHREKNMRISATISQVTIALLALLYSAPSSAKSNLVSFDYPGAINTEATGITLCQPKVLR
jgi:hypothetical protein